MWLVRVTGQSLARIADAETHGVGRAIGASPGRGGARRDRIHCSGGAYRGAHPEPRAIPRLTSGGAISSSASCAARRRPGRIVAGGRVRRPGRLHLDEPGPRRAGARHHGRPLRGDRLRADSRARGRVVQTTSDEVMFAADDTAVAAEIALGGRRVRTRPSGTRHPRGCGQRAGRDVGRQPVRADGEACQPIGEPRPAANRARRRGAGRIVAPDPRFALHHLLTRPVARDRTSAVMGAAPHADVTLLHPNQGAAGLAARRRTQRRAKAPIHGCVGLG
jgi:hypothetical protein